MPTTLTSSPALLADDGVFRAPGGQDDEETTLVAGTEGIAQWNRIRIRQPGTLLAISTSPHAVASVLQLADPERILFGSDFPALLEEDVQGLIQGLTGNPLLQPADLEMIGRRNALQLFPRLRDERPRKGPIVDAHRQTGL